MAVWWVSEALPIAVTALVPIVAFPLLGVMLKGDATAPYANPVIYLFMGGFMIASALQGCGLHRRIALTIILLVGTSPSRLIGGFMLATALISMWVSNTATAVMMLPMALSVIEILEREQGRELDPSFSIALLLGIAYSANIGGLGTLIGTPPNALLAGFFLETWGRRIGFVEWMLVGVPLVAVALPLCWFLLVRVLHRPAMVTSETGAAVIQREKDSLGEVSRTEWIVASVTAVIAVSWVARPVLARFIVGLDDSVIAIIGALVLFAIPVAWKPLRSSLDWSDAERLPWSILVLFGGGLSLANAIQTTGLSKWIGESLGVWKNYPVALVALVVATITIFLTEVTSNTATAAAFLPVVAAIAIGMGYDPLLLAIPTALAASCAFMMPVATPPNAIVYGSGRIEMTQMIRAGIWLNLGMIVLIQLALMFLIPLVFPVSV